MREARTSTATSATLDAGDFSLPFGAFLIHAAIWLAFTISSLALGLALVRSRRAPPTPPSRPPATGPARRSDGASALFLGLPVLAIVAVLTLVGIPFGLLVLLSMLPLYALGYVASAYAFGRALASSSGRFAAFLAGWAILRVVAFIPVLGALVWVGATVFGLGVLTVALWRSRGGPVTPVGAPPPATSAAA